MSDATEDGGRLALWDWRRRVALLYADVRAAADPATGWRHWRAGRDELCRHHPQSPLEPVERAGFDGLDYGAYDRRLRFAVALTPIDGAPSNRVKTGADGTLTLTPCARTAGLARKLGSELTLYWVEGYGGGVFLPFRDVSTGKTSYGGGRYLLDTLKGVDLGTDTEGRVILDFNFAYNPSCAYSPRWVCPLAPPENTLTAAVEAGERYAF